MDQAASNPQTGSLDYDVSHLRSELRAILQEKCEAAEIGLLLLNETSELKQRVSELECQHATQLKQLHHLNQLLSANQSVNLHILEENEKFEDAAVALATESISERLDELTTEIEQLNCKNEKLHKMEEENSELELQNAELLDQIEDLFAQVLSLQNEANQQSRKLTDCEQLEEDYIALDGQAAMLKKSHKELSTAKRDNADFHNRLENLSGEENALKVKNDFMQKKLEELQRILRESRLNSRTCQEDTKLATQDSDKPEKCESLENQNNIEAMTERVNYINTNNSDKIYNRMYNNSALTISLIKTISLDELPAFSKPMQKVLPIRRAISSPRINSFALKNHDNKSFYFSSKDGGFVTQPCNCDTSSIANDSKQGVATVIHRIDEVELGDST